MRFVRFLLAASIAVPASPLIAQPAGAQDEDRLTLGLGGGIAPSYDGSDDYRFQPGGVVQGSLSGFNFSMRGLNLFIDAVRDAPRAQTDLIAGPVFQIQTNRSGGIEDRQVRRLGTISATLEAGAYAGVARQGVLNRFDRVSFDLAVVHDVGGVHKSYTVTPSIGYFTPLDRKTIANLGLSARYAGSGYRRTYFDVSPAGSAASGLATYATGGAGFTQGSATLLLGRALGPDPMKGASLFLLGSYSRMLGDAARSPIVRDAGSRDQWFGVAGIAYSF